MALASSSFIEFQVKLHLVQCFEVNSRLLGYVLKKTRAQILSNQ